MKLVVKIALGVVAVAVLALGLAACATQEGANAAAGKPKSDKVTREEAADMVTAEMVVDLTFSDPKARRTFCKAHNVLGSELGFQSFEPGYESGATEGGPSAHEVYNEAASRC